MSVNNKKYITYFLSKQSLLMSAQTVFTFVTSSRCFLFALILTFIFYFPSLRLGSVNAGFLYTGDILGWYLPALAKTHHLLHSLNFTAIDYSTFNGSSDFFLSPNFFAYHPLVVIYSLLVTPETTGVKEYGQFIVWLMAIHSFLACYFATKLFTRFFAFEFLPAAMVGLLFAFSVHMLNALGQPPFFICASVVPWAAYMSLVYAENPSGRRLVFASLPVIVGFMGGYLPLGVASLALSAVIVAARTMYIEDASTALAARAKTLLFASFPYVCASLIVGPYLYSVFRFHHETSSATSVSLFYAAHQLGQAPQSFLHAISTRLSVPGRVIEFSLTAGVIVIAIAAIFLLSRGSGKDFVPREWKIIKFCCTIYFATVLAIFGDFSVVSDFVYYFIPQVGGMHLYERFLLPAHLVFAVIVALMLRSIVQNRPILSLKIAIVFFGIATLLTAYFVGHSPEIAQKIGFDNYFVFELFLGFLFSCALIFPGKNYAYVVAMIMLSLPLLDRMYDKSHSANMLVEQQKVKPFALDDETKKKIVSYFKRHSDKAIIKYVDITPMWSADTVSRMYAMGGYETFPKVFPDYVLNELHLSSYGGFTFYLSARADYIRKMPVVGNEVALSPDWAYLKATGADFLVARLSDFEKGPLNGLYRKIRQEDVLRLPNDVIIFPLYTVLEKDHATAAGVFDNGYFRISPVSADIRTTLENIALGKQAQQSSDAGASAQRAVDGKTNGDFGMGSVSHTLRDVNAWLQVDLGAVEPIDNVTVWNRTDCCGYCLRNYWLFISDKPFKSSDTAEELSRRPDVWSQQNFAPNPKGIIFTRGARGRYVRIQLPGDSDTLKECFLSIAELEVYRAVKPSTTMKQNASATHQIEVKHFATNYANYMRLDFDNSSAATVEYLFWHNPRLRYYLNGQRIRPIDKQGTASIEVPMGRNSLEVRYKHPTLMIFWLFYTLYGVTFLLMLVPRFRKDAWSLFQKNDR